MSKKKHDQEKKLARIDGPPIQPLQYRQPGRFQQKTKSHLPYIFICILLIFGILFFIPPVQPSQKIAVPDPQSLENITIPTFTPQIIPTNIHGGRIIFTCTRSDLNHLCLVNADGTDLTQLTDAPAHDYYPSVLSGGDNILFSSNRYGNFDIFLLILRNQKLIQLTRGMGNVFAPSFSADGSEILFLNDTGVGRASLWRMASSGKNPETIFSSEGSITAAVWSPDNNFIAMVISFAQTDETDVFLLDMAKPGVDPIRLVHGVPGVTGSLDWSPDGYSLLFCAGQPGDKNIYRLEIAANKIVQLTNGGNNAAAAYSPDGNWIAFNTLRNNGQADIYIMEQDGTYQRQVTSDPEPDWQPQWMP